MKASLYAAALLLAVNPVVAADVENAPCCYLTLAGGVSSLQDLDVDNGVEVKFDANWTGALGVGIELGSGLRGEVEFWLLNSDFDRAGATGFSTELDGSAMTAVGLIKAALDFHLGNLTPYVAIGIGVANFGVDIDPPADFRDSGWAAAGELEVGLTFPVTDNLDVFARTQVLALSNVTLSDGPGTEAELEHPTFLSGTAGLRFHF